MKITKGGKKCVVTYKKFVEIRVPKKTKSFYLAGFREPFVRHRETANHDEWHKAAQINSDIRQAFYHIPKIGRKRRNLFDETSPAKGSKEAVIRHFQTRFILPCYELFQEC